MAACGKRHAAATPGNGEAVVGGADNDTRPRSAAAIAWDNGGGAAAEARGQGASGVGSASVHAIAAVSENGVIGRDGGLPWSIPWDHKYFLKATTGGTLVLGRRTFEETKVTYDANDGLSAQKVVVTALPLSSLMPAAAPAPAARHGQPAPLCYRGVAVAPSVREAVLVARRLWPESPVWLCGGTRVYDEGITLRDEATGRPLLEEFHLTLVHAEVAGGDAFLDVARLRGHFPRTTTVAADVESGGLRCSALLLSRRSGN